MGAVGAARAVAAMMAMMAAEVSLNCILIDVWIEGSDGMCKVEMGSHLSVEKERVEETASVCLI